MKRRILSPQNYLLSYLLALCTVNAWLGINKMGGRAGIEAMVGSPFRGATVEVSRAGVESVGEFSFSSLKLKLSLYSESAPLRKEAIFIRRCAC